MAALSLMLLVFIQSFFSSGIRSTLKGTDTLESIRAASLLFAQIRKDLMACQSIQTGAASVTMGVNALNLPAAFPVSDLLTFCARNATTTYSLLTSPRGKYILRTFTPTVGPTETKTFGIPRVKAFEVVQVKKNHRILSTILSPSQLLVNVVIDSDDPRMPTKEIRLSSVFISQQMYNTNWNYFFP
ncbi:MAG: hypothetical protein GX442_15830 [Candidatus Riflebacteria bacterium]|nr:hypothetical protein [Candidatus Riflebacteria bacterium]